MFPSTFLTRILVLFLLFTSKSPVAIGQTEEQTDFEQFTIKLNVDKLGIYEMEAIYAEDKIYLPMIDLFRKLEIYLHHSSQLDTINGFILSTDNPYTLNVNSGKITFRDKELMLKPEQMITEYSDVYLPTNLYKEVFGLETTVNFRELTVFLTSDIELPIIKQLRVKKLRENLLALSGEITSDTTVYSKWNWIKGTIIDWNLQLQEDHLGTFVPQFRTAIGMEFLGGELNGRTTLTKDSTFRLLNSSIRWRYVNDQSRLFKQVEAGNITTNLTGRTASNFIGFKLTNTSSRIKKTFGSYQIQRKTNPGWEVELYLNGVLVNVATADMNGDFSFEVPLIFGNSQIVIRYYGPWGQESSEEIPLTIPFSFTAHKQIEYQTSSGITADSLRSLFHRTNVSYGVSRWATISTTYQYFQADTNNPHIFSGTFNLAIGNHLLFNYSYVHQASHWAELLYRGKRNFTISGKHQQFIKNQSIIPISNLGESEIGINLPVWSRKLKIYLRSTNRLVYTKQRTTFLSETTFSVFYKKISNGFSFILSRENMIHWNTSIYLKKNWTLLQSSFYNLSRNLPVSSSLQVQKKINKHFFAETSCTYTYATKSWQIGVGFYLDLSFARTSVNTFIREKEFSSTQTIAGSAFITRGPKPVLLTNGNNVGRSGLDVLVFLDINHNNQKDENEPFVKNAAVAINKGKTALTENDSVHRFVSLEPYSTYVLTIANDGFPSISWILEQTTWSVVSEPNQLKKIYIPVKPMGEVEVSIRIAKNAQLSAAARQIVYILDSNKQQVAKGITDQDGLFSYLGLPPGNYTIQLDDKQLKGLGLSSEYAAPSFEVKTAIEGDFIDGIEIIVHKKQ